jgi:ribosomal protein S20
MSPFSPSTFKRIALAGVAALVVGGAALGVASAQQAPNSGPNQARQQQVMTIAAQELSIPVDKLETALKDARKQVHQQDAKQLAIFKDLRKQVADTLHLTPKQLRQELAGKTLTDVAKAHSVDPASVAGALKTAATARIDQLVKDGTLTQDQATKIKGNLDARIQKLMTRQFPAAGANTGH